MSVKLKIKLKNCTWLRIENRLTAVIYFYLFIIKSYTKHIIDKNIPSLLILTLTYDLDFQFPVSYGHDLYVNKKLRSDIRQFKNLSENMQIYYIPH